jgi:N utilization substance protein A
VYSDPGNRTIQVVVDDDQLSLAIGRNGQNVRLASELTGWKIDLFSSREWGDRAGAGTGFAEGGTEDGGDVPLADINGIEPAVVAVLEAGGYRTLNDILDLDRDDFLRLPGIAPAEADHLVALIDSLTVEDAEDGQEEEGGAEVTAQ